MPLWRIYANPSTFSTSQKEALAKSVTDLYVSKGLPAFYVNVIFIDIPTENLYISGKQHSNFVRITVEQIARALPSPDTNEGSKTRRGWMDALNGALKEHILDRSELEWEIHLAETPRDLWRTQGLDPPPSKSEAEKMWVREDKAIPYHSYTNGTSA